MKKDTLTSQELAQDGMQRAVDHADAANEDWSERAFEHVRAFARIRSEFLGEDVRQWAYQHGLPRPPVECAWGSIMVRAARERLVVRNGYGTTRIPPQHSKPAVLWQSLLMQDKAA